MVSIHNNIMSVVIDGKPHPINDMNKEHKHTYAHDQKNGYHYLVALWHLLIFTLEGVFRYMSLRSRYGWGPLALWGLQVHWGWNPEPYTWSYLSTPSQRYPGWRLKRFGGGGGPLYLGLSINHPEHVLFMSMLEYIGDFCFFILNVIVLFVFLF